MIIAWILVGFLILFEGLVIGYFVSQKRRLERVRNELKDRINGLEAENLETRKAEDEATLREKWIRTLFDNTKDMVFVFGITDEGLPGNFLEVNDEACFRLKHTREDLQNMTLKEIQFVDTQVASEGYSKTDLVVLTDQYIRERHDKFRKREAMKLMELVKEKREVLEERIFQDKGGKKMPIELHLQLFDMLDQPLIMCTARDISERKAAEMALSESRQRFRDFFTHSPIGVAIYDAQRELVDVNPACLKMFGIPDREQFARFDIFANPYLPLTSRQKLDVGECIRDEMVIEFAEAIRNGILISARSGTAYFDAIINNMGLGRDFRPRGYFALIQDITERRQAEEDLKKNEEQMRQSEKMEAIGAMAGGIAHDFNNILTPIIGYVKMILRTCKEGDSLYKLASGIEKASLRAKDLVAQILSFSRKSDAEDKRLTPIHIIPIAKEVLKMQRQAQPPEIEINRIIKTESDVVMADPTKVHQVLMNLCTNAGHAMKSAGGSGLLEMMISEFILDARAQIKYPELQPGKFLRISVRDTGTGMPPEVVKRIFEPFFTTKKKGEGTGMGLSVVHGVIRSFKGAIRVDTEPGKGSTFHVILPTVDTPAVVEEEAATTVEMPTGTERILVVDDEAEVLEMEGQMLSSLGYKPIGAASGDEAVRSFQLQPQGFDLVVLDQVMTGTKGSEAAAKMLAIRPDIPIILMVAFADDISPEDARKVGVKELVSKPIIMADFAATIRKVLDNAKSK